MRCVGLRQMALGIGVGIGCSLLPGVAWADHPCGTQVPLFSAVGSQDVSTDNEGFRSFVVSARDKSPGCPPSELRMSVVGLSLPSDETHLRIESQLPGEVAATILVRPTPASIGTYDVTYTVTNEQNQTTSLSLPLSIHKGRANSTPTLDPISDLHIQLREQQRRVSFTVGLNDRDQNLMASQTTLQIDGLPSSHEKNFTRLTKGRIACQVTLLPTFSEVGTYIVHITGQDRQGGVVMAQMLIDIIP